MLRFPLLVAVLFHVRFGTEPKLEFDGDDGGECQAGSEFDRRGVALEYESDVGDLVTLALDECCRVWVDW